jgi:hypothetical protein
MVTRKKKKRQKGALINPSSSSSFFVVLELELRAYTLSHSAILFLLWVFSKEGLDNYLPELALNHNPLISAS